MDFFARYTPFILDLPLLVADDDQPWNVADRLPELLRGAGAQLGAEYIERDGCFIHRTARVHPTAILQDEVVIGANASIGPHVMLRGGVWIGEGAHIGGSGEIKQSIIGPRSAVAHLNYVGNSIAGEDVNIEAGAVLANHFNEREDKTIWVYVDGKRIETGVEKFGALVGDRVKIGANAVTTPGTVLPPGAVVGRLEQVQQTL